MQARNQLGTPGSEEFSERGTNFLNYVQYFQTISKTFFQGGKNISRGGLLPLLTGLRICDLFPSGRDALNAILN